VAAGVSPPELVEASVPAVVEAVAIGTNAVGGTAQQLRRMRAGVDPRTDAHPKFGNLASATL
jgi:hypothetical protein